MHHFYPNAKKGGGCFSSPIIIFACAFSSGETAATQEDYKRTWQPSTHFLLIFCPLFIAFSVSAHSAHTTATPKPLYQTPPKQRTRTPGRTFNATCFILVLNLVEYSARITSSLSRQFLAALST
ncbi:hypothetical protein BJ508DRAFT_97203 [Ascobolus immersus RN42]|uniref:Uncharacterized protein n=1 Tax=Ascobolus immersus RN42 TaxID=1160509 RepID=A0A3N4IM48_ASCIM|nr:hypothetical protein BJ508DRAFT_97203 [Ascobolus immersus RN42]